jgi:hypothetical protein
VATALVRAMCCTSKDDVAAFLTTHETTENQEGRSDK